MFIHIEEHNIEHGVGGKEGEQPSASPRASFVLPLFAFLLLFLPLLGMVVPQYFESSSSLKT